MVVRRMIGQCQRPRSLFSLSTTFPMVSNTTGTYRTTQHAFMHTQSVTADHFSVLLHDVGISTSTLSQLDDTEEGSYAFAVALSGGADSLALLLLLHEYMQEKSISTPLLAITIDHQLREESAREAQYMSDLCKDLGHITHVTGKASWSDFIAQKDDYSIPKLSKLEEAARDYRYKLLGDICSFHHVSKLFVAHNLGDQLETTLFRLGRASGVNGLAGMASISNLHTAPQVQVVRPLLSVTKESLKQTCQRFGRMWVEDQSNEDDAFDRVRIRKALDALARRRGTEPLDLLSNFQKSMAILKEEWTVAEQAALDKHTNTLDSGVFVLRTDFIHDTTVMDELKARVLTAIIKQVGGKSSPPRLSSIQRLVHDISKLPNGKQLTLGGCKMKKKAHHELHFEREHK